MKGVLFLCVANSARSQMAEGIARSLAPAGTKIWSAGSRPTNVRPEAIAVLKEIGIDISRHRAKAVAEIPAAEVDTVITLCGEEECPVFLGKATRLHWGLPDPAAVSGSEAERLDAARTDSRASASPVSRLVAVWPERLLLHRTGPVTPDDVDAALNASRFRRK
jgi:protein-tyrosine-phosphatase